MKLFAWYGIMFMMLNMCACSRLHQSLLRFYNPPGPSSIQAVFDQIDKLYPDKIEPEDEDMESIDNSEAPQYSYQPIQHLWIKNWIPFVKNEKRQVPIIKQIQQEEQDQEQEDIEDIKDIPKYQLHAIQVQLPEDIEFYSKYSKKFGIHFNGTENKRLLMAIDQWLGTPYRLGGCSKKGIDCSCLVKQIYKDVYDIDLYRTSHHIFQNNTDIIDRSQLKEGDILSFRTTGRRISHIGIYLKDDKFVHTSRKNGVMISDLKEAYFRDRFLAAGRIPIFDFESEILALTITPYDKKKKSNHRIILKKLHLIPSKRT